MLRVTVYPEIVSMMVYAIVASVGIGICAVVSILAYTKKSLSHIVAELRYEIIYNYLGMKALLEDIVLKEKNVVDLALKSGKTAVVTGGSRGIGAEVVRMLLECDMHIIIGCRNVSVGKKLYRQLRDNGIKTGEISIYELDTSSLESVRLFAQAVKQNFDKIDLLVNNAGKMFGPFSESADGYESQFATNYLGHFLLTHHLLPLLKTAGCPKEYARIVNVSSCAHLAGEINFKDINYRKQYITSAAYAQSKFAQILFTNYLNMILRQDKACIQVHSTHPGIVYTDLFEETLLKKYAPWMMRLLFKTPSEGAITVVYASIAKSLQGKGGSYLSNCRIVPTANMCYSTKLQKKFFDYTNNLLKIEEFGVVA